MRWWIGPGMGLLLAMGLSAGAADAQPLVALAPVEETYSHTVNVGGFLLVGLRRGSATGKLDLKGLKVEVPGKERGDLCVRLTTRDGAYSARQGFSLSGAGAGVHEIQIKTQFARELSSYVASDLAVRAEIRRDCARGSGGEIVPVLVGDAPPSNQLVALVNLSGTIADASLLDADNATLARATCESLPYGSSTAFNHACLLEVDPAEARRVAKLRIVEIGATGSPDSEIYPLSLSGHP